MATKRLHYQAQGTGSQCVEENKTAKPCTDISEIVLKFLGVTKQMKAGDILYRGNQFELGEIIDRVMLIALFKQHLDL